MNPSKLIFGLSLSLLWFLSCCGRSSNDTEISDSVAELSESENVADNLVRIDLSMSQPSDNSELVWYKVTETSDSILIKPTSEYYDDYTSKTRLNPSKYSGRDLDWSDFIENPIFELNVVNNEDHPVAVSEIEVSVTKSKIDTFPYIYLIEQPDLRYSFYIYNEAWSDWGKMIIEYSLPHAGEKFSGKYKYKLEVPYFSDKVLVDVKNEVLKEGFNPSKLNNYYEESFFGEEDYQSLKVTGNNSKKSDVLPRRLESGLSSSTLRDLAYPFEYVETYIESPWIFATLYGKISFTKHPFTKEFQVKIPLTSEYPGGAENTLKDHFQIQLKPQGENYNIKLPYITTLGAGASEKIQLTIKCEKSSLHNLRINLKNSEGEIVTSSKPINFYNLNGRHSSYYILKNMQGDD